MKKYLVLFISVIILSLSLCIPSFASNKRVITLSDDYKFMYYNGSTYTRADTTMLSFTSRSQYESEMNENEIEYNEEKSDIVYSYTDPVSYDSYYTTRLTEEQHKEVKMVEITNVSHDESLFYLSIYFYDGTELYIDFIREDLVEEYENLISGNVNEYYIDFSWPEENIISVKKDELFSGKETKINTWDSEYDYLVYANSATESFDAEIGIILKIEDDYYLYSFIDSEIKSSLYFWELGDDEVKVIKLDNESIIEKIKLGEEKRQEDEFGYLYNDELTEAVSKIFFTLVFAILPAIVFVVSLIFAFRAKKSLYKKLMFATSGLSIASLVTFIYIAFTLFNK